MLRDRCDAADELPVLQLLVEQLLVAGEDTRRAVLMAQRRVDILTQRGAGAEALEGAREVLRGAGRAATAAEAGVVFEELD